MSLTHHFPEQANTINTWIIKNGTFDNSEESATRLAIELGQRPVSDTTLDQAWARVKAKPAPSADVDTTGLAVFPAMALVEALRQKLASAPDGVARGQALNALNAFLRVSQPWIFFEGR